MVVPIVVTSFIALTALEFDPRGFHEVSAIRFSSIFTPKTPISIESRIPPSNCRVSFEKKIHFDKFSETFEIGGQVVF